MFGGRLFWFVLGFGAGVYGTFWFKRRLKQLSFQRQIADRLRNISKELRTAVSEGKEAIRLNGR